MQCNHTSHNASTQHGVNAWSTQKNDNYQIIKQLSTTSVNYLAILLQFWSPSLNISNGVLIVKNMTLGGDL